MGSPQLARRSLLERRCLLRHTIGSRIRGTPAGFGFPGASNPARYVGSQGALLVQWRATRHAALDGTYSHFFAGPFLQLARLRSDVDFVALWLSYAI